MKRAARTSATISESLPAEPRGEPAGVPLSKVRDEAWKYRSAETQLPGVTPAVFETFFAKGGTPEGAEDCKQLLGLLCRPSGQRERMQRHWNGNVDDIEATRALFTFVLSGEMLNAISFTRESIAETQLYAFTETAIDFVRDLLAQMAPRDPMERLLILQGIWVHARLARLTVQAAQATGEKSVRVLNEAADRAANTYRRHLLALKDYRTSGRPRVFMPIRSAQIANAAGQQVVNAHGTPRSRFFRTLKTLQTKRNRNAIDRQAVPTITPGATGEAGEHPEGKALAPDTRADHD